MLHPMGTGLGRSELGMTTGEASRAARRLARAERRGALRLGYALAGMRQELARLGLEAEAQREGALVLLALGLRRCGLPHAHVVQRLEDWASPALASAAALRGAALLREGRPTPDPARLAAARRRAAVLIFLAFVAWGALGVELLVRAGV
jgi:hypothetical protein